MKWGLFGGTFDPIHLGHLRCAQEILELFHLDRIIFIPASCPPHKTSKTITPYNLREEMIRLAIRSNPAFLISDVEARRTGKSYSVETVKHFINSGNKELELFFILGQDAFFGIQTWKDWKELMHLCNFVVMTRPGYEPKELQGIVPSYFASEFTFMDSKNGFKGPSSNFIFFRQVTFLDISATDIRKRVRNSNSIRYLVPEPVREHVISRGLYLT